MENKQYYGIKYPFLNTNAENYFFDLNQTISDKVKSLLMHVIFTPKGQKIRDPEFGTNLIQYIFESNNNFTWDNIKNEISETVQRYVNGIIINNISTLQSEDNSHEIFIRIDYSINQGNKKITDSIITKIS